MKKVDVAIVGGGPGGLAAAHGILRAKPSAKVAVLERRSELTPMGAGIVLLSNGMRALSAICPGAAKRLLDLNETRNSTATTYINSATKTEKLVKGNPSWDDKERRYGLRPASAAWYQLQHILADELQPGVLKLGSRVTSIECDEDDASGVQISINGSSDDVDVLKAGFVIGADGFFSRVRAKVVGDGNPTYQGSRLWRALVPRASKEEFQSLVYSGENYTFLYYAADSSTACWVLAKTMPEPEKTDKTSMQARNQEENGEEIIREVLDNIEDSNEEIINIVKATDPASVTTHGVYVRDPFANEGRDLWKPATGPYTLIGDAAHPMRPVGNGTAMAMEDAAELACCVQSFGLSEEAFREYELRRIPRSQFVAQKSQITAMASYKKMSEEASKLQLMKMPNHLRVANFSEDMDYEDWLHDIAYPELSSEVPAFHVTGKVEA